MNDVEQIVGRKSPVWLITDFSENDTEEDKYIEDIFSRLMRSIDDGTFSSLNRARSGGTPVYYSPDRLSVIKHCRSAS